MQFFRLDFPISNRLSGLGLTSLMTIIEGGEGRPAYGFVLGVASVVRLRTPTLVWSQGVLDASGVQSTGFP